MRRKRAPQLRLPDDPEPAGWQDAVDAARVFIVMDILSALGHFRYAGFKVNLARCWQLVRRGAKLGYRPEPNGMRMHAEKIIGNSLAHYGDVPGMIVEFESNPAKFNPVKPENN